MKWIFSLFCLITMPLMAETIGIVEYQLPKGQEWEVGNKVKNEDGVTIIYVPKGASRDNLKEFFGVNANEYPTDLNDTAGFKAVFNEEYPDMEVDVKILEKTKDSLLYEWSAIKQGKESIHGWGKVFSTKEGTVLLEYRTEDFSNLTKNRDIWMPVLKQAKVIQESAINK